MIENISKRVIDQHGYYLTLDETFHFNFPGQLRDWGQNSRCGKRAAIQQEKVTSHGFELRWLQIISPKKIHQAEKQVQ